jgi:hypothetical protein
MFYNIGPWWVTEPYYTGPKAEITGKESFITTVERQKVKVFFFKF